MNRVLLVIDVQQGILDKGVFQAEQMIENINKLIKLSRNNSELIIFIRHTNDGFLKAETPNWQISSNLNYLSTDYFINKTHGNVFLEKPFLNLLEEKDINEVLITGLVTNGCIKASYQGSIEKGYKTILYGDAHSTYAMEAKNIINDINQMAKTDGNLAFTK